jgi:hypothetical protein
MHYFKKRKEIKIADRAPRQAAPATRPASKPTPKLAPTPTERVKKAQESISAAMKRIRGGR